MSVSAHTPSEQASEARGFSRPAGQRFIASIWDHPLWWLAFCLIITVAAAWQARAVSLDNSLQIWFAEGDPALTAYQEFQDLFGSDEIIVVTFHEASGITDAAGLSLLRNAGAALSDVNGIARVESLTTLFDEQAVAIALEPGEDGQGVYGRLVSSDRTTAVILAHLETDPDIERRRDSIINEMNAALDRVGGEHRMIGIGVIYSALNKLSRDDTGLLFSAACLVMALLLWCAFGRLAAVMLCLLIVGTATVWVMGALGALGRNINMVTMVLPTLVTVIGVANYVHVLRHVMRSQFSSDRRERIIRAVGAMVQPCLFITITTAGAFAALSVSPMPVLRDLGGFAAFGMLAIFVLTFVFTTQALRWPGFEPRMRSGRLLSALSLSLTNFAVTRRKLVLALTAGGLVAAGAAMSHLVVDTYSIGFMPFDHPLREDYRFIEEKFTAYTPLEFVVRAEPNVPRAEVLAAVADWQERGSALPGIGWSNSLVDMMKRTGMVETPQYRALDEQGVLRVSFATRMQSARNIGQDIDRLLAQASMPIGVSVEPNGYLPLYVRMMDRIVSSQIWGFAFAFAAVMGALLFLLRSLRLALIAVPVNLLPIGVVLGFMGLIGIPLDVATVTIAAIVLGIAVDDSIFFLDAFGRARRRGLNEPEAIRSAAEDAGSSMVLTTIVLALGFLVCAFADIKSVAWFGLLLSLAMTTAVISDLTVLPALLAASSKRRISDSPMGTALTEQTGDA